MTFALIALGLVFLYHFWMGNTSTEIVTTKKCNCTGPGHDYHTCSEYDP